METTEKTTTPTPSNTPASARGTAASTVTGRRGQQVTGATLTRQQREQLFDEAATGMVPECAPKEVADPLKAWWPQITRKLKQGYSPRQIHQMACSPKVGLKVGFRTLRRRIAEHTAAQAAAKSAAKPARTPAVGK